MRSYFLGSGIILAFLYILIAAFLVRMLGIEVTRYWSTVMMAAGVLLGRSYGIILITYIGTHIVRRLLSRRPIMETED
jgi:hypothetical protein